MPRLRIVMSVMAVALLSRSIPAAIARAAEPDKPTFEAYQKQYFIGHYNPRGNHFFAFAIKNTVVDWLDPKPITYRNPDPKAVDCRGYLPDAEKAR